LATASARACVPALMIDDGDVAHETSNPLILLENGSFVSISVDYKVTENI
jgi:hypothetical protein